MLVLSRSVGVIGAGWARGVVEHTLSAHGWSVIDLDTDASVDRGDDIDAVVVVGDDVESVKRARRRGAGCLQVRTTVADDDELLGALLAGANGVITDAAGVDELLDALRAVAEGGVALNNTEVRRLVETWRRERGTLRPRVELTARQRSVLELICQGESVKQTARTLGIAVKTVENTQSRLYRRLGVRNRSEAVAVAMSSGLLAHSSDDVA